jgi:hypothetical protein
MNTVKKAGYKIFLFACFLSVPLSLLRAQSSTTLRCNPNAGMICNPLDNRINSIPAFIRVLLEGFIKLGIPALALAIMYCGFLFVAARGNSEKLGKAKTAFFYTIIGGGLLLGALGFATLISNTITPL